MLLQIAIPIFLTFDMSDEPNYDVVYNTNDELEIEELEKEKEYIIQTIEGFNDDILKFLNKLNDKYNLPAFIEYTKGEKYYLFKIDACFYFLTEVKKAQDEVKNFITSRDKKKKEKRNLYYKAKSRLSVFSITIYNILYDLKREELRYHIYQSDEYEDEAEDEDLSNVKTSIEDIEKIITKFIPELNEFKFTEGSLRDFMVNIFFNPSNDDDEYFITTNNTPIDRTPSSCSKDSYEINKDEKEFTKHTSDEYDDDPELLNALKITSDPIHVSDGKFQNDLPA